MIHDLCCLADCRGLFNVNHQSSINWSCMVWTFIDSEILWKLDNFYVTSDHKECSGEWELVSEPGHTPLWCLRECCGTQTIGDMYKTYADAVRRVRQTPNLPEKQEPKYITLTSSEPQSASPKAMAAGAKLDQVPNPRVTLFRRDQVELGYRDSGPLGPGSGMFNMGNTCYLNSTLQVCQWWLVGKCVM